MEEIRWQETVTKILIFYLSIKQRKDNDRRCPKK